MKRNTPAQSSEKAKEKSLLESMIPASTTRGRKRGANNSASEQATLDILSKFKSKLEAAPAPPARSKVPELPRDEAFQKDEEESSMSKTTQPTGEEEAACDLHFIVGCQSCTAWDKQDQDDSDDDTGWMSHALSFAKDRLGKDLEWKRKNEEELVVIDPREKEQDLKAERRAKREWDDGKERRGKKGVGIGGR